MSGEDDYLAPVTAASEPLPAWRRVWPFRLVLLLGLALVALGIVVLITHLNITGAGNAQG